MKLASEPAIRALDRFEIGFGLDAQKAARIIATWIDRAHPRWLALFGDDTFDIERIDRTQEVDEREQAEARRARERPNLIEAARLCERGEHAAIGFVAGRRIGRELDANREA